MTTYVEPETVITGEPTDRGYKFNKIVAAIIAMWKGVAAGDMEYYTGATAKARLAISTAGNELGVAESGIAPGWLARESMQLIETFTAAGGETSHTFNSIPQTFKHLRLIVNGRSNNVDLEDLLLIRFNDDSGGVNYCSQRIYVANNAFVQSYGTAGGAYFGNVAASLATANHSVTMELLIPNYTNATFYKIIQTLSSLISSGAIDGCSTRIHHSVWRNTAPIAKIKVYIYSLSAFVANSKMSLYGLK